MREAIDCPSLRKNNIDRKQAWQFDRLFPYNVRVNVH